MLLLLLLPRDADGAVPFPCRRRFLLRSPCAGVRREPYQDAHRPRGEPPPGADAGARGGGVRHALRRQVLPAGRGADDAAVAVAADVVTDGAAVSESRAAAAAPRHAAAAPAVAAADADAADASDPSDAARGLGDAPAAPAAVDSHAALAPDGACAWLPGRRRLADSHHRGGECERGRGHGHSVQETLVCHVTTRAATVTQITRCVLGWSTHGTETCTRRATHTIRA